jgi:UPF0755 protein
VKITYFFSRFIGFTFAIVILTLAIIWIRFLITPLVIDAPSFHYVLQPGASIKTFVDDLQKKNILTYPRLFKLLLWVRGDMRNLKAGEYIFKKGITPSGMVDQMVQGRGIIYYSFTIIAGWNFKQLKNLLLQEPRLKHPLAKLHDKALMQLMGNSMIHPEGQFLPDTYYFMEGSEDIQVLKRAYHNMQTKFNKMWQMREANLPYKNAYEALIAASLIEKEAYLKAERPIIAGVLVNRIKRDMILQFDPTVIYGMGSLYSGKLRKSDLQKDTPYNTYKHKGLPPTPIAMPSVDSLIAAMHPAQHQYLYFVAKGDGSHQFSPSLNEHAHAINQAKKFAALIPKEFFNRKLVESKLQYYLFY